MAATTSGSALAALAFWESDSGRLAWQILLAIAAVVAVAKPFLRMTDRIQRLEEIVGAYRMLEHDLKKLEVTIKQRGSFDSSLQAAFRSILDGIDELVKRPAEHRINPRLRAKCEAEVRSELPQSNFFVPGEA